MLTPDTILLAPDTIMVTPSILLEKKIELSRKKVNAKGLVDRGIVNLKVIRDTSGSSFLFVGEFCKHFFQ